VDPSGAFRDRRRPRAARCRPSRVAGGGAPPPPVAPGTATPQRGPEEGCCRPTTGEGSKRLRRSGRARWIGRCRPVAQRSMIWGRGRGDDVAWWDPRVRKGIGNLLEQIVF
jgi:hypothetical protein